MTSIEHYPFIPVLITLSFFEGHIRDVGNVILSDHVLKNSDNWLWLTYMDKITHKLLYVTDS